jgi:tetratricopeptide (TPR) repeat protein
MRFAEKHPGDVTLAQAETSIPERAHNEYLQIAAELGLVGVAIFAWFLFGIVRLGVIALGNYRRVPLHSFAALLGIAIFFASSLVTSYSFRLVQNGLVFFFVLAVLVRATSKLDSKQSKGVVILRQPAFAVAITACLVLTILSGVRVANVAITTQANSTPALSDAVPMYRKAMTLDPEDPLPHFYLGLRYVEAGEYEKAIPLLKESIRIGKAPSSDYSYLATAQSLAGDNAAAEWTFAEAAVMYPRSTFVLARYAALLKLNGREAEAEVQMQRARAISERDANGWLAFITSGSKVASELAFKDPDRQTPVMDLKPYEGIYAVLAERDILYPDEREKFPWEKIHNREGAR